MENAKKNLKVMSIVIIILALLSMVRTIVELIITDYTGVEATQQLITIALIITAVVTFIILIPQFYIGFKGIKVAKNPDSSKAHIVWAIILLVVSVIVVIINVVQGIQQKSFSDKFASLGDALVDVACFSSYIGFAKELRAKE